MDEYLCKEYSPSQWTKRYSPNEIVEVHGQVLKSKSESAYQNLPHYSHKLSDKSEEQRLEIFFKSSDSFSATNGQLNFNGRKIFVYLHGGYWQWGSVFSSSFMAENFVTKDIVVVALGYDLAPNVTITELVQQVETGIVEILKFSRNSEIYLCGHSAGAHLASCIIHGDLDQKYNVSTRNIRGIFLVAGVYDLVPLLKTDINDNVKMDLIEATSVSTMYKTVHVENFIKDHVIIHVSFGENESNEFKRQSNAYSDHLRTKLGFSNVTCEQINSVDHFDLIENLSDDNFILTQKIYQIMNISS